MSNRSDFVKEAYAFLGTVEGSTRHSYIVTLYNSITPRPAGYKLLESDAWCAAFVSAMSKVCNLLDVVFPECSCPRMVELYKKAGRWVEDDWFTPQPGDLIFYSWRDTGEGDCKISPDHVGIVYHVTPGGTMTILEGNYNDRVGTRTLPVGSKYIRGFATPDFEREVTELRYHNIKEVPEGLYRNTVQQMMDMGVISGKSNGDLDLTEDMIRSHIYTMRYIEKLTENKA